MQQDHGSNPVAVLVEEPGASRSAVEWAAREAGMLGRRLVLVCLVTVPYPTFPHSTFGSPWDSALRTTCLLTDAAEVALRIDPRVQIELQVLNGPPGRTLLERTAGYRLLAVPQHGRRSFAGIPVGSWAPWLAAHAWCPVVLVPDGERPNTDDGWPAIGFDEVLAANEAYVADDDEADGADYERPLSYSCQGTWA